MKLNIIATMLLASTGMIMTGCGSDSGSSGSSTPPSQTTPEETVTPANGVERLIITDASHLALADADIRILSAAQWSNNVTSISDNNTVDHSLFVQYDRLPVINDFSSAREYTTDHLGVSGSVHLAPGIYYILVRKHSETAIVPFIIHPTNTNKELSINVPLTCNNAECETIHPVNEAIIGTLSGQVLAQGQPLTNAQVSLSGGAATNGAFVTALTDAKGYFSLAFNVSDELGDTLKNATLMISAPDYISLTKQVAVTSSISGGSQFTLIQNTEATTSIWQETFEEDSATRDEWENASTVEETKWSLLQKNHKIINKDVNRLVTLAPDDSSNGKLPDPAQGNYAYWYGNSVAGSFLNKEANLLTEEGQPVETRLNGGTSSQAYYGTLTSPVIDLSTTQKPISLSFKTWWEIESVNPSSRGYDAMDVEVSVNGGEFKKLVRLNPLSDPQTDYNRWSIPFSNFGFNLAPQFAQQEAISLDEYAGQSNVKIRFKFDTVDQYYNAYRGWIIDDIVIQNQPGTFPLYSDNEEVDDEVSMFVAKAAKALMQSASSSRWIENPPERIQ
ncbi:carboxypeptidase-like regulatory domain-containing protein [Acinetobacter schindleri]|uniref:carboxypeptidase-like regulatory domain-containing protein n=1 Tax=Acinetobacter schindleri TaxID=108981 RepID=UPI0021CD7697|nr:carboxypeptidase-like regulatory domain-containing protein [Acinetobacter schindleri]MCU4323610.1 carboxypeptidase-like regulatory domain-containing protein [Acinetobacter schindleri]